MGVTVTGPVTGGAHGWPFSMPLGDLASRGYVAEELFLEGEATAYRPTREHGLDGYWDSERAGSAPYRSRMLVVRPADAVTFNGVVHVNWQNVTAGFEIGDAGAVDDLDGRIWVGVSAQKVGVDGYPGTEHFALKGWDHERYGSLQHPGDDYSFDIYTQAARALGPDTLGGLEPRTLVASGGSQSAIRLRTYANVVQPIEGVFDAFWLLVDFGRASVLSTTAEDAANAPMGILPSVFACVRDDLDVPVFVFNSECEASSLFNARQPDSDTFRLWEVTGTAHTGGASSADRMAPLFERDGIALDMRGALGAQPEDANVLAFDPALRAATHHFNRWVLDGEVPPAQPRIEFDDSGEIVRDENGNALGGIRLPDFAVPTAEHRGAREGDPLTALIGSSRPFPPEKLLSLYGDRDGYLKRWNAALDEVLESKAVLQQDAPALREGAEAVAGRLFPG